MQPAEALKLLDRVAADILAAVNEVTDRRARSDRPGQYQLDLVADGGAVATLTAAGLGVLFTLGVSRILYKKKLL